jgi:hypothetical protein
VITYKPKRVKNVLPNDDDDDRTSLGVNGVCDLPILWTGDSVLDLWASAVRGLFLATIRREEDVSWL